MNKLTLTGATLAFTVVCAHATTVYSNAAPGDAYTNASPSNQGQAVGATGWYYNNVRHSGTAGIDQTYARNGNGSARLQTIDGNSKADIEYLADGFSLFGNYVATSSLGRLGDLSSLSYEWFRAGTSTNSAAQMPAARILVDADGDLSTIDDRGGLVYELAYNGGGDAPTDQWVNVNIGSTTNLWNFGAGMSTIHGGHNKTLDDWINGFTGSTLSADSLILGFSFGVGSGWGPFDGAVDTVSWTLNGQTYDANFEAVPEPATMGILALAALVAARKRKKA